MKKTTQILTVLYIVLFISCSSDDPSPEIVPEPVSFPEIPNGDFESWKTKTQTIATGLEKTYYIPNEWTENVFNLFTRFYSAEGFLNKYDYPTGDKSALQINRSVPGGVESMNNGFIRFNYTTVPNKLTGTYRFTGSSLANTGVVDTLIIAVRLSKAIDTISPLDLGRMTYIKNFKQITISKPTENFKDFEIDLSEYLDQEFDYATIQLIMKMGDSGFSPEYSSAIIDNLKFE